MSPRYDKSEPARKLTPEEYELKIKGPEDIQMEHPLGGLRWVAPRYVRAALEQGWKHTTGQPQAPAPSAGAQGSLSTQPPKPKEK